MVLALVFTDPVSAQTRKLALRKDAVGESRKEPYITHREFRTSKITGDRYAKGGRRNLSVNKILTLPSLDSLTQYLGSPEEMSKGSPYGESVLAYINYKGLELEYVKAKGSAYRLRELKITTPEWHFTVNGTRLRPGLEAQSLDDSVRRRGHMLIAAPGAAGKAETGGELEVMEGHSSIQIDIDEKTQEIKEVRFHRML